MKMEENPFLPLKEDWVLNPLIHIHEAIKNDKQLKLVFNQLFKYISKSISFEDLISIYIHFCIKCSLLDKEEYLTTEINTLIDTEISNPNIQEMDSELEKLHP